MAYTCSIDIISKKFKESLSSESKVKETLLSFLKEGANIEDIILVVTAPISSRIIRTLNPAVKKFIQDEKGVRDFLGSPKVINTPLPVSTLTKEIVIDNPDSIVLNGKRSKIWLSEAWGTASLAQHKFIQATNRELQSRILGIIKSSGLNEDAEIVLNSAIQLYFEFNLRELRDFFDRLGRLDYSQLISDNMPFDGPNPNSRINTIIRALSEYFSEYSDSEKMAYNNPKNPNYDRAQAFARFLLILPLNFDNFISSNVNSIQVRNRGKLVVDINKYGILLGKGRLNMTWQDEDAVYSLARMVDDFVLREIGNWSLYRKVGNIWERLPDEYCETNKVVSVLTKILKISDLDNSKFKPIILNKSTKAKIDELKDTFRIAFGINILTGREVIDDVFEKYIEGKTLPQIIKNINQDPHHLLPIIMYLLTELNNDSKKSIIETNIFKEGIIKLNDNEINIIHSIWHNMFDPMNNNSLYNQVSLNKDFDLYQMVIQVLLTHDKKELYGIVNDMGTVEKKDYSLGRANQRLNQLQSKINGFYSPLLTKPINNITIENDFESEDPVTIIKYKVPFKNDFYVIKIIKGNQVSIVDKYGNKVEGIKSILKALKDLKNLFNDAIKVNFSDDNLLDIYINKLGGSSESSFKNLVEITANLIYANEVSKYLKGESTSDFKNKLKKFYTKIPKLVKGVTYNQVDAFSGRMFPLISEISLANDINEGIIGDIVVKGGAGEQINSIILRTLTTNFSLFVEEKSQDPDSAIKHFSIRDAFKRMTFLRDYVDKTGDVKSSTLMNVEEFFLNSFIYDFYGDSLAVHLGVLSDKPNIPKMELYVNTPILIGYELNGTPIVKKLKDCTAEDLKKVAIRELGQYYLKMKLEIDRNLRILSQYSPRGIKYNINTDYIETRNYSKSELEKDIHDAIYAAQQAGEDIEINELLYFSWDKNGILHTKPSLIAELAKHDVYIPSKLGLQTENSSEFFDRKEHELVINLLLDLKHGISFIDSQSLKIIDSSAVKAMRKANDGWKTSSNIIIGKILYGDKSKSLITKKSLTDWKIYKDFMTFANEVAGTEFDLSRLDINGNFDFLYFFLLLNNNYDRIQEYSKLQSLKRKLESAVREKLSSPRVKIDKKLLTDSYRQWRLDNIEETEAELNQAVINYETEPDLNIWIRRNKAFQTEGIKDITSIDEIEQYKQKYNLQDFDTNIEIESLTFSLQINPEISRYNTLHYLYSEEGLNSTVGSHINHKVGYTTDLSLMGALETGQQAKRNVSESGAKNQYTRGDINGTGKTITIAVVKDVKAGISTVNGVEDAKAATVMDGSTVGNYVTRKEELHSLGSQKAGIENSKPLGDDLNAKTGTGTIIKTAVFVLTNGRIRSSERNIIMHKHMNSIPWDPNFNGDFLHDFDGKDIKYHPVIVYKPSVLKYYLRSNFQINSDGRVSFEELEINNNILSIPISSNGLTIGSIIRAGQDISPYINIIASVVKPKNIGDKITTSITTTRPIRTNYELWDLFGGAYSASINDFNELTYLDDNTSLENLTIACHNCGTRINKDVTRPSEEDVYLPLKKAKIDWIVTEGAIKQGASNVNSTLMFSDINYKITTLKIATADIGMLLNPEHLVDKSHITLMTQVVNALGLRGFSVDAANRVYKALATLTDTSLNELFKGIEIRRNTGDDTQFKDAVASLLLKSIIGTSETDGDLLSSIVIQLNKLDRNGHDYDIIRHRLPISDPAILNKLISNFSSLMTKAGVRILFPGSMNVLVPSDGIYRIHGGKLMKFASTLRYKDSEASKTLRNIINLKGYAIVWAHPGIGKSYSVELGLFSDRIIDWDIEYNRIRDLWIAEHSNTKIGTKKFNEVKREYLINYQNYPDYMLFLIENWERIKLKAKLEKKILVASPHALLKMFSTDFDEIINLPDNIFIERNVQRGGTTEDSINLKNDLNTTIDSLNNPNLVTTDLYLEEILNDTFNSGNLIENDEAEVEQQKLQELQAQQLPLAGLYAITIGGSYFINLNTNEEIEPWDDLSARILSGESIKIDDLSTYYKVRDLLKGVNYTIVEDVISGRELAPYNCTFNTDKGMYMLWDLDSIKHIHMIENDSEKVLNIYSTYTDEEIAREFHINPSNLDRTILFGEKGFDKAYKRFIDEFKKLINRRKQLELNSIGSGNENVVFIDGQRVRIDKSTLSVSPYELIAPKNYETDFGLRIGDDVSEIASDNLFFLKRVLKTQYKLDSSGHWVDQTPITSDQYDIILKTISGKNYPILFKNPNSKIPEGLERISEQDFYINLDWDGSKVYRLDGEGNRLYELPYHRDSKGKIIYDCEILTDGIGNEVIYTDRIDFFTNKLHFSNIDFGKHIIQLPFIYDIFKLLENSKKKSVKNLFNLYIKQLPLYKLIKQLEKKIIDSEKEHKNSDDLNKLLVSITSSGGLNTILSQQITLYFDSRDKALTLLNTELLSGEIKGDYPPMIKQMIDSSIETHTSFIKSLEYIVSRTPAQSHQSFMPMKLVAFDESGKNSAYVNRYLLYLQGSDFDVDKASLLGSIIRNGRYVRWSPYMSLKSIEHLKASETLPFPTNKKLQEVTKLDTRIYDVMDKPIHLIWEDNDRVTFSLPNVPFNIHLYKDINGVYNIDLNPEQINSLTPFELYILERAIVDKIPEGEKFAFDMPHLGIVNGVKDSSKYLYDADFDLFIKCFIPQFALDENGNYQFNLISDDSLTSEKRKELEIQNIKQLSILLNALNNFGKFNINSKLNSSFIKALYDTINEHNTYFEDSSDAKDAVVNYISSNMFLISSDPVNLVQAMTSVDQRTDYVKKEIANKSPLAELSKHFDKGNIMSTFRLLRLTLSGKQNTGIEASSLKVMEAINQYLDIILNYGTDAELKSLIIPINIGGHQIGLICNAYCKNIANIKSKEVYDALQQVDNDEDLAIWLSTFLSLSTDNAKDPTLAKINANPEMIGLYNSGFVLGLPIDMLSKVIMSPTGIAIAEIQSGDVFLGYGGTRNISSVIDYIKQGPRLNPEVGTLSILTKAIQAQYGEDVEVNSFNLAKALMPGNYWDLSSLLTAKRIIGLAKSLAYGKDGEEIKYNLPTISSRLKKDISSTKNRIYGINKAIQALNIVILLKESENRGHKREDKKLTSLTEHLEELQERLTQLLEIRNIYESTQEVPNIVDSSPEVYKEYYRYSENLKSLERGEQSEALKKSYDDFKDYARESANFKKTIQDLEDWLNIIETLQLDEGYVDESGQRHNTLKILALLNEFANEMALIRPNLALNLLLPNSKESQLSYIKKFENIINDRLTESEIKESEALSYFELLNESKNIPGLNVNISEFIWDEDYRRAAIAAYDSIKFKVNVLDVIPKVPHYFRYLKACDALYESLKYQSILYREQDRILEKIIINDLKIKSSKDIQSRLKTASRYISRQMNNMFLISLGIELSIPKITNGEVDNSTMVPIKLGTLDGNKAFKEWMDLVVIPKYKLLYKNNKFFNELSEATYHKSDNHNTIINYTTGIDTMTSNPTEVMKYAEVVEGFNNLSSKSENGIPLVDAFFYYDLIAYDRQPGLQALTPIFNKLASLGKTRVISDYIQFISDLDLGGNYILTLDDSLIDEIKRFIAPVISIYELDKFNEDYAWVKDPADLQYYLILKTEKPSKNKGFDFEGMMEDPSYDDIDNDDLGIGPDGDVNLDEGGDNTEYKPIDLSTKIQEIVWELNKPKFTIISEAGNLNNPYMDDFTTVEYKSILEGQGIISSKEIRFRDDIIVLDSDGKPIIPENIKAKLRLITGQKEVDSLIVTKVIVDDFGLSTVIDIDTTKENLENPCK